jgi:hypothetical protein
LSPSRENKAFLLSKKPEEGKGFECIFPLPFLPATPCKENKVFFHSWELKEGKGSAGERMKGDCSIPFISFFK